jgi:O-antigen/teichoic acid export membrane protein
VTGVVTARILQPEGRGDYAILLFWPNLIASLSLYSLNDVAATSSGSTEERRRIQGTAFLLAIALSIPAALASILTSHTALRSTAPDTALAGIIFSVVFIPINFVALMLIALLINHRRFDAANYIRLSVALFGLGSVSLLALSNVLTASTAAYASLGATVAGTGIAAYLAREFWHLRVGAREISRVISLATPLHINTVFLLAASQADKLLAMLTFRNDEIGIFVVAATLATAATSTIQLTFHQLLLPQMASIGQRDEQIRYLEKNLGIASAILWPTTLGLALVANPLIITVFGEAYRESATIMTLLLLGGGLQTLRGIATRTMAGTGYGRAAFFIEAASLAALLLGYSLGSILLSPSPQVLAVALIFSSVASISVLHWHLKYQMGIELRRWIFPSVFGYRAIIQRIRNRTG